MNGTPLPFAPPCTADVPRLREAVVHACTSDLAVPNIILLSDKYHTTVAFADGFFFRHFEGNSRLLGYAFPIGEGDVAQALHRVREDAATRNRPFRFCLLSAEQCDVLRGLFPDTFSFSTDRGDADYIYRREALAELPGTPYHGKRNHIAQFIRACPNWFTRPLSNQNTGDVLRIARAWLDGEAEVTAAMRYEARAIERALSMQEPLRLTGLVLYVNDAPVAMAVGSMISSTVADVHYEKCIPDFRRAYSLVNREFARSLPATCTLINREEDLNSPGLRQAKLSYHPSLIFEKFTATC